MKRLTRILTLAALIPGLGTASLAMVPWAAQAAPRVELTCGASITTNAFLSRDLSCTGDGITVAASGVTIDLRGHRLSGYGTGTGIAVATDDLEPVTITRGTVSDFERAVRADASVNMRRVTVARTSRGFDGYYGAWRASTITNATFVENGVAIIAVGYSARSLTITNTKFVENSSALTMHDVAGTTITGSTFMSNNSAVSAFQSDGHTIAKNSFTDNGGPIVLNQSRRNTITQDRVVENAHGLVLRGMESQGNVITDNLFLDNETFGAHVGGSSAIVGAEIAENIFKGNRAAGLWFIGGFSADGSNIRRNVFQANGFNPGGLVDEHGMPLDDGLHVFNPASAGTVTVTDNLAVRNAGHGIEAAVVVDGGGNIERRNGAGRGLVR